MLFELYRVALPKLIAAIALCTFAMLAGQYAHAQNSGAVEGVMQQFRIERAANGQETRIAAQNIKPGELLEYAVRYTNKGETTVNQLVVTLPIPPGLELLSQSDRPSAALASLDGIEFKEVPLIRTIKQSDGREVIEAVPLNEYRALRWQVGQLPAGKTVEFAARAKVDATPARQ